MILQQAAEDGHCRKESVRSDVFVVRHRKRVLEFCEVRFLFFNRLRKQDAARKKKTKRPYDSMRLQHKTFKNLDDAFQHSAECDTDEDTEYLYKLPGCLTPPGETDKGSFRLRL